MSAMTSGVSPESRTEAPENLEMSLATSWTQLAAVESAWDKLWHVSEECDRECYCFQWMTQVAAKLADQGSHPWCPIFRRGDEVVAIAPLFQRTRHVTRFHLPVRGLTFFPNRVVLRHGILSSLSMEVALRHVLNAIWSHGAVDVTVLHGLSKRWASAVVSEASRRRKKWTLMRTNRPYGKSLPGTTPTDLCCIVLPETWELYYESRSGKWRQNLRRAMKRMGQRGQLEYHRYRNSPGLMCAPDELISCIQTVEEHAWQAKQDRHLGSYGYDVVSKWTGVLQSNGVLDASLLFLDGRPIAYFFGVCVGKYADLYHMGYDERLSELSPGMLLLSFLLKDNIENTAIREINLTGAPSLWKQQVADKKDHSYEVHLYHPTLRGLGLYMVRQMSHWHTKDPHEIL